MANNESDSSSRVHNILQNPAYRRADRDLDFLDDDAVRGGRPTAFKPPASSAMGWRAISSITR